MAAIKIMERINAPIEHVFNVLTNIPGSVETISGIKKIEMLTETGINAGTRWKETRVMFGKECTEELWISEFESPNRYVVECESCGARYRTEFRFASIDNYTTDVSMDMKVTPLTIAAKLMSPLSYFMRGSLMKTLKKDLEDARDACETRFQQDSRSSVR